MEFGALCKAAQEAIEEFTGQYQAQWLAGMRAKLGLIDTYPEDEALIDELLSLMQQSQVDYTNTFRALTLGEELGPKFQHWHARWQERQPDQALMRRHNPAVIPRNHRVEEVLAAAEQGDFSKMERFFNMLSKPYAYTPEQEEYAQMPVPSCSYQMFCGT